MQKTVLSVLILLAMGILAADSMAGLYVWTDENGVKHYSDTPPSPHQVEKSKTPVKAIKQTIYYQIPIFTIKDAPDPGIVGAYHPVHSTRFGFPQYRLKGEEGRPRKNVPSLSVITQAGRWRWKIKTGYSTYISGLAKEGTPADRAGGWSQGYVDVNPVSISIDQDQIVTTRKIDGHNYLYDLDVQSDLVASWQKMAFRISGYSMPYLNGEYYPVNWSSETPRYKKDRNICLNARPFADQWEWHLGECDNHGISAEREPAGTMPHQANKWYERRGWLYIPLTVQKIDLEANGQ